MTYTITHDFSFSASHRLDGLPEAHPCGRLHGHNYVARVQLRADDLDINGMVFDWRDLRRFTRYIEEFLDHRHLNGVIEGNPTAERLADYLLYTVCHAVDLPPGANLDMGVSETPNTWAWSGTLVIPSATSDKGSDDDGRNGPATEGPSEASEEQ